MADDTSQGQVTFQSPTTGAIQPVPPEHWDEALQAGYKPVSHAVMYDQDGNRGMVPREQMADYTRQGYTVAPKTQFEKNVTGEGISLKGAGTAAWNTLKSMIPADPTGGHSIFSKEAWLGDSGHVFDFDANKSYPAQAVRETRAALQRGAGPVETAASALGPLVGVSGERQAANAARGEGGTIIGETAVPAAMAAAPLVGEGLKVVRGNIGEAIHTPEGNLTPAARTTGQVVGAIAGTKAGSLVGHPYVGTMTGYKLGPGLVEKMFPNPVPETLPTVPTPQTLPDVPGKMPSQPIILSPDTPPAPLRVTYQSLSGPELQKLMNIGDVNAMREQIRNPRPDAALPPNAKFMLEQGPRSPFPSTMPPTSR